MPRLRLLSIVSMACAGVVLQGCARESAPGAPLGLLAPGRLESLAEAFPEPDDAPLEWPRDHGARPEQFADAWLFAGLLKDGDGRRYGFQLGFWRIALQPEAVRRESAWAARELIAASMAISPEGGRARGGERFSRAALGLAGAGRQPARAWLEDWAFSFDEASGTFLLCAAEGDAGMELRLQVPEAMPVAVAGHQHRGYWWPGLSAQGVLRVADRQLAVSGHAMLDRLWGRALPAGRGQLALSRIWLELADGTALRCEQLRRKTGGGTPLGECLQLGHGRDGGISIEPARDGWRDLEGTRYPLHWRLQFAARDEVLDLRPVPGEPPEASGSGWRGTIVVAGQDDSWGLLDLSNFAAP